MIDVLFRMYPLTRNQHVHEAVLFWSFRLTSAATDTGLQRTIQCQISSCSYLIIAAARDGTNLHYQLSHVEQQCTTANTDYPLSSLLPSRQLRGIHPGYSNALVLIYILTNLTDFVLYVANTSHPNLPSLYANQCLCDAAVCNCHV